MRFSGPRRLPLHAPLDDENFWPFLSGIFLWSFVAAAAAFVFVFFPAALHAVCQKLLFLAPFPVSSRSVLECCSFFSPSQCPAVSMLCAQAAVSCSVPILCRKRQNHVVLTWKSRQILQKVGSRFYVVSGFFWSFLCRFKKVLFSLFIIAKILKFFRLAAVILIPT